MKYKVSYKIEGNTIVKANDVLDANKALAQKIIDWFDHETGGEFHHASSSGSTLEYLVEGKVARNTGTEHFIMISTYINIKEVEGRAYFRRKDGGVSTGTLRAMPKKYLEFFDKLGFKTTLKHEQETGQIIEDWF